MCQCAHLASGEHNGGHLRAVAPLGEKREHERLHEHWREERARQAVRMGALDAREDRRARGRRRPRALDVVRLPLVRELYERSERTRQYHTIRSRLLYRLI